MKLLIVLGFIVLAMNAVWSMSIHDDSKEWNLFKVKFNKSYTGDTENALRKNIYLNNMKRIEEHNKLYNEGLVTYKLGLNKFGDMSNSEFIAIMQLNNLLKNDIDDDKAETFTRHKNVKIPVAIDWRTKGYVTPVKDQGQFCGSCWAFSSTGALEAQHVKKTGKLVSLSEQNLVDCSNKFGNQGCNGGLMNNAFEYVKHKKGICPAASYPYTGQEGKCKDLFRRRVAKVKSYVNVDEGNEDALMEAVATVGPVSVAIDASSFSFRFYTEGVFYDPDYDSVELNHGVLAVGYNNTESNDDYWIVKNSWGPAWGDNGYILMARNMDNNCGIASMASYPLL